MKPSADLSISQNRIFAWIAVLTGAVLLVALTAMQFTNEVAWTASDFAVFGTLLFGIASLFVLAARRIPQKHRLLTGGVFLALFLYAWAELAVGVFANLGS